MPDFIKTVIAVFVGIVAFGFMLMLVPMWISAIVGFLVLVLVACLAVSIYDRLNANRAWDGNPAPIDRSVLTGIRKFD